MLWRNTKFVQHAFRTVLKIIAPIVWYNRKRVLICKASIYDGNYHARTQEKWSTKMLERVLYPRGNRRSVSGSKRVAVSLLVTSTMNYFVRKGTQRKRAQNHKWDFAAIYCLWFPQFKIAKKKKIKPRVSCTLLYFNINIILYYTSNVSQINLVTITVKACARTLRVRRA